MKQEKSAHGVEMPTVGRYNSTGWEVQGLQDSTSEHHALSPLPFISDGVNPASPPCGLHGFIPSLSVHPLSS